MDYASLNIIKDKISYNELAKLTNTDNPAVIDEVFLQSVIDEQKYVIDGYLRGRYTLPLEEISIDEILIGIHSELVIIELNERRNYKLSDALKDRKEATYKKLRDIQSGRVLLQTNSAIEKSPKHFSLIAPEKKFDTYIEQMP
jgi:phage gp36-like protein